VSKSSGDSLQRCMLRRVSLPGHRILNKQTTLYIVINRAAALNASPHMVTFLNVRFVMSFNPYPANVENMVS
jgi:hypothetical protein